MSTAVSRVGFSACPDSATGRRLAATGRKIVLVLLAALFAQAFAVPRVAPAEPPATAATAATAATEPQSDAARGSEASELATRQAEAILQSTDIRRGICVLVSPDPAGLALALARQSELIVYVPVVDRARAAAARAEASRAGLLGTRVYIDVGAPDRFFLADRAANLVVVTPEAIAQAAARTAPDGAIESLRRDALRVVSPLGRVLWNGRTLSVPFPPGAADWSHPYHGPDNNCQSSDRLAVAPYLTQFLAEPWYVPFPEVTVASAGRVFKAFGHVGFKQRDWPWLNRLIALDGSNGTILWQRPLEEGFNIHRNTMIATPDTLYVADSRSCKRIDAATGEVRGEIVAPEGATGNVWKWMALVDGVLYALVGEEERRDPTLRGRLTGPGWPWQPMTPGYDDPEYSWGFGRTWFAHEVASGKVLWTRHEDAPIDSRAVAMTAKRIYYYSEQRFVACLDAETGTPLWRQNGADVLEALGPTGRAQSWQSGFSTTAYLLSTPDALYFAGPQRPRTVALSTEDGRLLWQHADGNMRLLVNRQGLYAMGKTGPSKLFDPLTGQVRAEIPALRGNCTRVTGSADSVFARGDNHGGTLRLVAQRNEPRRIATMRPDCHDGVIVANGLLYWGPWMCDCNLSLVGIICLGPAGDFDFEAAASEADRLESFEPPTSAEQSAVSPAVSSGPPRAPGGSAAPPDAAVPDAAVPDATAPDATVPPDAAPDWPTYRADNRRSAACRAVLPPRVKPVWRYRFPPGVEPAAPILSGGMAYLAGTDGTIRAIDAADGTPRWEAHTGGFILFPPSYERGRLFAGSGDGWIYAFDARDGRTLWRFRAAPVERRIMVYGRLASNWPVASGALVDNGVVYAAAGIASHDGTHVYALDAATGRIIWQNHTSGRLGGADHYTGVSVQGHLLLHDGKLYLAGGNVVSPAVYDAKDGRCLNALPDEWVKAPRGRDLTLIDGKVTAFDRLLYAPQRYWPGRYFAKQLYQADAGDIVVRAVDGRVARLEPRRGQDGPPRGLWESNRFVQLAALALADGAVVAAGCTAQTPDQEPVDCAVEAMRIDDGATLWSHPLPSMPVLWGIAMDRAGHVVVATLDGEVVALGPEG